MNKKLIISVIGGVIAWLAIIKHPWATEGESPLTQLFAGDFKGFSIAMQGIISCRDAGTGQSIFSVEHLLRTWGSLILIVAVIWFINKKRR